MSKIKIYSPEQIREIARYEYLNLGDEIIEMHLENPLEFPDDEALQNPYKHFINLMMKPENFYWVVRSIFGIELLPFQLVILTELWNHKFPMLIGSRGCSKTFLLALYATLRCLLIPNTKVVVVGAAFRQAKILYDYALKFWNEAPLLQNLNSITGSRSEKQGPRIEIDRITLRIGSSEIIGIPIGDGQKIRGLRANVVISDEHQSINEDIYERVVKGFGMVSQDPVEKVKREAERDAYRRHGVYDETLHGLTYLEQIGNQSIISGTAYYEFNHFAKYYKRYKQIIESRGRPDKLRQIFNDEEPPPNFNWKDYSLIRIPVDLLPKKFMDEGTIASAKVNSHQAIQNMELFCIFSKDSEGFFKRSLIESCVANETHPVIVNSRDITFRAALRGSSALKYVYGVDPAAVQDNFSIVVLEIHPDHRRIVYCWTTNKMEHKKRLKAGVISEHDFYGYCARKIRDLMRVFPCWRIALDGQGGGIAIEECLADPSRLLQGEQRIFPTEDPEKPKDSDREYGQHILEIIQFSRAEWVSEANHGMRKDFEDHVLLFPFFDPISIEEAIHKDDLEGKSFDTLEDNIMNIEQLKDELSSIIHTQTTTGRDHFDTPEIKLAGNKKGRQRKDRYSALLMANMVARQLFNARELILNDEGTGGYARDVAAKKADGSLFIGPAWFQEASKNSAVFGGFSGSFSDDY